jgi:hypothetical protein
MAAAREEERGIKEQGARIKNLGLGAPTIVGIEYMFYNGGGPGTFFLSGVSIISTVSIWAPSVGPSAMKGAIVGTIVESFT